MVSPEDFPLDTIPVPNPAVLSRSGLDGGLIMVNCDTGGTMALNETGAYLWSIIDGHRTVEEISTIFERYFSHIPDNVIDDVRTLLSNLAEDGFIGYEVLTDLQV
jgi:hypothetical protein